MAHRRPSLLQSEAIPLRTLEEGGVALVNGGGDAALLQGEGEGKATKTATNHRHLMHVDVIGVVSMHVDVIGVVSTIIRIDACGRGCTHVAHKS